MRAASRLALVSGGNRGIGKAIVQRFCELGHPVAYTYHRQERQARELAQDLAEKGAKVLAVQMDQASRQAIRQALSHVRGALGPVQILINNAAMAQEKPFQEIQDGDWDRMLRVNLRGPFTLCQEILPDMQEAGWGRIVNLTSIGGQWGGHRQVHYAASKAGLISLTRSLARLYSDQGITSNAVSPGLVESDMATGELQSEEGREKVRHIPLGRVALPDEVAQVVGFLASHQASYITGQTINVNGGMYFG